MFSRCGITIFLKNMRSAGAEQLFSKKINVQQVRNNHFSKKHAFSRCGTTVFGKTHVPRGWNNCFRKKQTFQGVGTTIFEKNRCSKGLEQPFSRKTMRCPRTKHTSNPFSRYRITPPRIFLLPLLPQIQIQIRYYGD